MDVIAACGTLLHRSNEPASTQSKSSDDTDVGRLIFTLDSPSSPLDCDVYLPTQLVSAEDRGMESDSAVCAYISSNCL